MQLLRSSLRDYYRAVVIVVPNSSWHQPAPSVLTSADIGLRVYAIQDEELQFENTGCRDRALPCCILLAEDAPTGRPLVLMGFYIF